MTADFDTWINTVIPADRDDSARIPDGVMEILRATFDARGAVDLDTLDEIFSSHAMRLAEDGVALFMRDVARTTTVSPSIRIYRDDNGSIVVSWNGNYTTPVFFAMRNPEATCEIADNLRDHVVDDLAAGWPLCPAHGVGLYPDAIEGEATWFCRRGEHVVSTIGQLPSTASARTG